MKSIQIFDPALCCSSGVCGPSPDQALAAFASVVEKLKQKGISVKRFNLSQEPLAFAEKAEVKSVLEKQGEDGLPLIFIDDELYFRGVYPSLEQLSQVLGLEAENTKECCAEDSDCGGDEPVSQPMSFVKIDAPKPAVDTNRCHPSSGCC